MKKLNLQTVIWKEGKFYVAQCLNVDVSSFGKTRADALKNIQEALALYFEGTNKKHLSKVSSPSLVETSFVYA